MDYEYFNRNVIGIICLAVSPQSGDKQQLIDFFSVIHSSKFIVLLFFVVNGSIKIQDSHSI